MKIVNVIGAGLAGCEAALQLAKRGVKVRLFEMKPERRSAAHHTDLFAELVCSNSLKAARVESAAGLLKEEMRRFGSICLESADRSAVAAGGALAVDRDIFSEYITDAVKGNENIEIIHQTVNDLDLSEPTIVATGPLTDDALFERISELCNGSLSFLMPPLPSLQPRASI